MTWMVIATLIRLWDPMLCHISCANPITFCTKKIPGHTLHLPRTSRESTTRLSHMYKSNYVTIIHRTFLDFGMFSIGNLTSWFTQNSDSSPTYRQHCPIVVTSPSARTINLVRSSYRTFRAVISVRGGHTRYTHTWMYIASHGSVRMTTFSTLKHHFVLIDCFVNCVKSYI